MRLPKQHQKLYLANEIINIKRLRNNEAEENGPFSNGNENQATRKKPDIPAYALYPANSGNTNASSLNRSPVYDFPAIWSSDALPLSYEKLVGAKPLNENNDNEFL